MNIVNNIVMFETFQLSMFHLKISNLFFSSNYVKQKQPNKKQKSKAKMKVNLQNYN